MLLLITYSVNAQFSDDFENYTLGNMADQNPSLWGTWTGNTSSLTILIDNDQSLSGSKSGYVGPDYVTDAYLLLGNKSSGVWTLIMNLYIPSNKEGYLNIAGETSVTTGGYGGTMVSGNIFFNQANSNPGIGLDSKSGLNFNFPHDTWFEVSVLFDIDNLTYQLTVNNVLVNITPEAFASADTIGAVDFFSSSLDTFFWVDDIEFISGTLNIENSIVNNNILLFPNPTSGLLKIRNTDDLTFNKIIIHNTLGQIVIETTNADEINFSNLNSGIYYLSILFSNNDKSTYKVIKE